MNKIEYPNIQETLYHDVLDNGLNVFILPKAGFSKTYVTFSTLLGGLNNKIYNDQEVIELPEGVAHFLEHKLFEQDGMDVSTKFAIKQANVNAYTSHNRTTYLFSATDYIEDNIKELLDFVLFPQFTDKGIQKEIGIITQEINMYKDDPNAVVYNGILGNLYKEHPIKNEILGSVESINKFNKELLETIHQTYYHPENMVLFITGNVDADNIIGVIKNHMKPVQPPKYKDMPIKREANEIHFKHREDTADIMVPNFVLGVKLQPCIDKTKQLKKELALSVLLDLLLGKSTDHYKALLEEDLINDSFGMDINFSDSFAYFIIGSETRNPDKLNQMLRDILLNCDSLEITDERFLKTKKQTIGGFIQALNNLEYIANNFTKYYYQGSSLFDILEVSQKLTKEDVIEMMKLFTNEDQYTTFTLNPKK